MTDKKLTIKITFGTGKDAVTMTDKANSIIEYLEYLKAQTPWNVEEITRCEVVA